MVYLIKEVVADMKAFIVILIYSTLGFAVLFLAMDVIDGN